MQEVLAIGFFGTWALACLLVHIPRFNTFIRARDWCMLIPEWRFFAPTPAQGDYHLLYRDIYFDGGCTEWTEVRPMAERHWWNVVWNPGKRERKALFDAVTQLSRHIVASDQMLEVSVAYLTLLNHISSLPRSTSPAFTRFLLMQSSGSSPEREPDVIFVSGIHAL